MTDRQSAPTNSIKLSPPLDNEILRERILNREGGPSLMRGSLSKCAARYRDFSELVLAASEQQSSKECDTSALANEIEHAKDLLEREIRLHDLEIRKLFLVSDAADAELAQYDAAQVQIESSISDCKDEIEELKKQLAHERKVRSNREEYETLAKMARQRPARRTTEKKLEAVKEEIEKIRAEDALAMAELDVREKQFQLLMQSIFDLKSNLSEDLIKMKKKEDQKDASDEDDGDIVGMETEVL
mmetsp:Transcript_12063/g.17586  ORF Transcript_12063/g.17586 Transcript_12063/m.17586 type:complete len:244 (+) Transcript_12063:53-784(+)